MMEEVTHKTRPCNPKTKDKPTEPVRFARQLGELSRQWMDETAAGLGMKEEGKVSAMDRRLSTATSYLCNILRLTLFIEDRTNSEGVTRQFHFLPVQTQDAIDYALKQLSEQQLVAGVGVAIRQLGAAHHMYADGSWPIKPGHTPKDAKALGIRRVKQLTLDEARDWMTDVWRKVSDWDELTAGLSTAVDAKGNTRLPAIVLRMKERGDYIAVRYIDSGGPSGHKIAEYCYISNAEEREQWKADDEFRKEMAREQKARDEVALKERAAARAAKRQAAEAQKLTKADTYAAELSSFANKEAGKAWDATEGKHKAAQKKVLDNAAKRVANMQKPKYVGGSQYGGYKNVSPGPAPVVQARQQQIFRAADNPSASKPTAPSAESQERLNALRAASVRSGYGSVLSKA